MRLVLAATASAEAASTSTIKHTKGGKEVIQQ